MDVSEKNRIIKLIGMLGSAFDGERANAAAMLSKMAEARKMTLNELIEAAHSSGGSSSKPPPPPPPPPPPEPDFTDIDKENDLLKMLARIADRPDIAARVLTQWEINFSTDVSGRYSADYELSPKQLDKVEIILRKASRVFK
jgi:hypothetical protein